MFGCGNRNREPEPQAYELHDRMLLHMNAAYYDLAIEFVDGILHLTVQIKEKANEPESVRLIAEATDEVLFYIRRRFEEVSRLHTESMEALMAMRK